MERSWRTGRHAWKDEITFLNTAIYDKKANAIPAWLINEKTKEVKLSWQLR